MHRNRKLQSYSSRSPAKALSISRQSVQAAKLRLRKPFFSDYFEKSFEDADPEQWKTTPWTYTKTSKPSEPGAALQEAVIMAYPRQLIKPSNIIPVSEAVIAACDPELRGAPLSYVRRALVAMGPKMLGVFQRFRADPPGAALPREMNVTLSDFGLSCMPTHLLAVYNPPDPRHPSPSARASGLVYEGRTVSLWPVHVIVLLAYCGNFPRVRISPDPPQIVTVREATPTTTAATVYRLPVIPLRVAKDFAFPHLLQYLYTLDKEVLLSAVLFEKPTWADPAGQRNITLIYTTRPKPSIPQVQRIDEISERLGNSCAWNFIALGKAAFRVDGVWRNGIVLAVNDDVFWDTINLAWQIVLAALRKHEQKSREEVERQVAEEQAMAST